MGRFGSKISKSPQFKGRNGHETPPPDGVFFFMFHCFFLLILAFFCLCYASLPLLLDIFKPKKDPPNEALGYSVGKGKFLFLLPSSEIIGIWFTSHKQTVALWTIFLYGSAHCNPDCKPLDDGWICHLKGAESRYDPCLVFSIETWWLLLAVK